MNFSSVENGLDLDIYKQIVERPEIDVNREQFVGDAMKTYLELVKPIDMRFVKVMLDKGYDKSRLTDEERALIETTAAFPWAKMKADFLV